MNQKHKKMSTARIKLYVDIAAFLLFAIVCAPQTTGIAWHEWLSFIFVVPIVVHLLLNWKWIVSVTRRFFKRLPGETRFNQIWNLFLFVLMTVVTLSGVVISEAALPALGIPVVIDPFWTAFHSMTANVFLVLMSDREAAH